MLTNWPQGTLPPRPSTGCQGTPSFSTGHQGFTAPKRLKTPGLRERNWSGVQTNVTVVGRKLADEGHRRCMELEGCIIHHWIEKNRLMWSWEHSIIFLGKNFPQRSTLCTFCNLISVESSYKSSCSWLSYWAYQLFTGRNSQLLSICIVHSTMRFSSQMGLLSIPTIQRIIIKISCGCPDNIPYHDWQLKETVSKINTLGTYSVL